MALSDGIHKGQTFTKMERFAAQEYQATNLYKYLNGDLRSGKELKPNTERVREQLDGMMDRSSLPKPVMLFRGGVNQFGGEGFGSQPVTIKAGTTIEDKGYGSTSTTWETSVNFGDGGLIAIRAPKGSKAIGFGKVVGRNFNDENEILLPRGSRYRVTDEVITRGSSDTGFFKYRVVDLLPPAAAPRAPVAPKPGTYGPTEPSGQGTLFKSAAERLRDKYSWKPGDVTIRPSTQEEIDQADANVAAA